MSTLRVLSLLFLLLIPQLGVAQVWRLASIEWPPYSGEKLAGQGEAVQQLRSRLKAHGIELEVDFMPWNRAVKLAHRGRYIGYFPAWPEEVASGFIASAPIDSSSIALISHRNANITAATLAEALADNRIGIVQSYVYPSFIQDLLDRSGTEIDYAANDRVLIRLLAKERVKLGLTDPRLMQYYSELDRYENLTVVMDNLKVKPLVIALTNSTANRAIVNKIQDIFSP